MRHRNAGVRRRRHARGNPRHHLEAHPRGRQCLRLLAAAAEHERVAALEAHHQLARRARAPRAGR